MTKATKPPIHRLTKKELVFLATHYCPHGHTYLQHYACYQPTEAERIGFLDIEASNLVADFGIVLSYCIKDHNSKKIYEAVLRPQDIKSARAGDEDKEVIKKCIKDLMLFDRIVTYYGCVTPGHRVLKSNLEWVPIETLIPGDALVGFTADGPHRRWETSIVKCAPIIRKPLVKLTLSDGTELTCTKDHPWLAGLPSQAWRTPEKMNRMTKGGPTRISRLLPVWKNPSSYKEGYLAGFFDGEGCLADHAQITGAQKVNSALATTIEYLSNLQFPSTIYTTPDRSVKHIRITGGTAEGIRFLGQVRPKRLLSKFNLDSLGEIRYSGAELTVESIEDIGEGDVVGLSTTTETYLVEGFGSHNTGFDLPFLRARAIVCKVDFPVYGSIKHTDLYYIIRNKIKISSRRLENACRVLLGHTQKTRIENAYWRGAVRGDKKSLDYVLDHNRKDVLDLEKLYEKVIAFSLAKGASI